MPARLVTIPISHYCERARWALDRAGIVYREERHVQIVHRVASRRAGGAFASWLFRRSADQVPSAASRLTTGIAGGLPTLAT